MTTRYTKRLIEHLSHDTYEPVKVADLTRQLGVPADGVDEFDQTVSELQIEGRIRVDGKGQISLPQAGDFITGILRKNIKGFGFVEPDTAVREGDIFIPPDSMGDSLSGDIVKVRVFRDKRDGRTSGSVVQVVKRKRSRFTGVLSERKGGQWLVMPDGKELRTPIVVRDPESKNAKPGDKVVLEITAYPEGDMLGEGVIVQVLGQAGLPRVETQAVIEAYNLPGEFPERVVAQAREAADQFKHEIDKAEREGFGPEREDLRDEFIITIDPPDAKDYDDAIHIKRTPDGGWELGVHIADVAHFIPGGSALDLEALERGNSCYLPRHVIPMLPENLSNGICSLQEGVPRFCKSAFMVYARNGDILKSGASSTCIKSKKRLTYLEAQALIDGNVEEAKKHAKTEPSYTEQLIRTLKDMDACSKAIRSRRRAAGMIHLELPDVELVYDEQGNVVDAQPEDNAYTHTLIEMFMVEANEVLARLFERLKVPLIRRVHPEPVPGDVDNLRSVVRVAGYAVPKSPTRMELQKLLDATAGTAAAPAVHMAVLRTLTRAEYSPALVGHYALASEAYAHFTSPIRRYADLTVHRALAEYLHHTHNGQKGPRNDADWKALGRVLAESDDCPPMEELEKVARKITMTEENAAAAERDLRQYLVLQLLSNHIGEEFRAMVTGVTGAGVFVRLEKYLAEGMIKSGDLPAGKDGRVGAWRIDQRTGALVNAASGRSFAIGDRLSVTVLKVELSLRQMELAVADAESREKGKGKKVFDHKGKAISASDGGGLGVGGGLNLDWEAIKRGKDGAAARSQRSKQRGIGKNKRRDK
ncbi:MAG: ribonuclease R family protein [Phycisphaerales bacterium]